MMYDAERFEEILEPLILAVEERFPVEESIKVLSVLDRARKRIDRIQANPKRSMTMADGNTSTPRPEREGREGDTQPMPVGNDLPIMHEVVIDALRERLEVGIKRYGQPLQPHNGRDAAQDAFEEVLDLSVYLAQVRFEMADIRRVLDLARGYIAGSDCPATDTSRKGECKTCSADSSLCPRSIVMREIMAVTEVGR